MISWLLQISFVGNEETRVMMFGTWFNLIVILGLIGLIEIGLSHLFDYDSVFTLIYVWIKETMTLKE